MRWPGWAWSKSPLPYLNGINSPSSVAVIVAEDVLGNLLGAFVVGEASVDEVGLSVLLDLEY